MTPEREIPDYPMGPDEAAGLKRLVIPAYVFKAVNKVLIKEFNGKTATLRQGEIIEQILAENPTIKTTEIFTNKWMDFELAYIARGWQVVYDKPGFNESGEAIYKFSRSGEI